MGELKHAPTLPVTFIPMEQKPKESGNYQVIWHDCCGEYSFVSLPFSKRYNMWGTFDTTEDAEQAVKQTKVGIQASMCIGWAKLDIDKLVMKLQEEDDF